MKKFWVVCIVYGMVGALLFFLINFAIPLNLAGDFKEIEHARKSSQHYDNAHIICTMQTEERYVDFYLNQENNLYITTIEINHSKVGQGYEIGETMAFYTDLKLEENQRYFEQNQEILWENTNDEDIHKYSPMYWTIMPSPFEEQESNVCSYPFEFEDKDYVLCIKTNE